MTLLFLFLAIAVKSDHTPLREECSADSETVATVAAGARVTVRFAVSGEETPCYKVAVEAGGKTVEGYLSASELTGLNEFDEARREAPWVSAQDVIRAVPTMTAAGGVAAQASRLLEASRPAEALDVLRPEASKSRDPNLLALAGLAAWRADDPKLALDYWKTSLDLKPNPDLARIYKRVEREAAGDQSTEKLVGMRVALRYDPNAVPADTARAMLGALDQDFARVSAELGCAADERVVAIVQTPEAYRKTVDVAEWNAGQFDGRIRVPVTAVGMEKVLLHETVHACLAMTGRWPSWLHEGLAQKLSGDVLTAGARAQIAAGAQAGKLPRLENLGQDWSRLDTAHATMAYAESLAAVELFYENDATLGIRNLLRNPEKLSGVTAELDRALGF